jgi:hypothetical protein
MKFCQIQVEEFCLKYKKVCLPIVFIMEGLYSPCMDGTARKKFFFHLQVQPKGKKFQVLKQDI